VSDPELLQIGDGRRWLRPSRRVRLVLVVVAVAVIAIALLADQVLRDREARAVVACADAVTEAVEVAGAPVRAAYEYVRPSLGLRSERAETDGLFLLIAKAATDAERELAGPGDTCETVSILPLHSELRQRRDRCVDVLDAQRSRLMAVAENGEAVLAWTEAPRSC
jgi:hypothetical protein